MKEIPFSAEEETLDVNKPMVTSERVCAKMDWKKKSSSPDHSYFGITMSVSGALWTLYLDVFGILIDRTAASVLLEFSSM